MPNSDSILSVALKKITSSAVSVEKSFLGDYFISRTGVLGGFPGVSKKYFIGGFSCKKNLLEAEYVSRCEVAERLLATYNLSLKANRDTQYILRSVISNQDVRFINADEVLLGPTLKNPKNSKDAVGLGFHSTVKEAITHAVFELLERNILGKIWYEACPLIKLSEVREDDIFYSEFTIKSTEALPFVMCVMHDRKCNFLCVGASFTNSIEHSREKSKAEAIMLAHNILNNKSIEHINNHSSRVRFISQSDPYLSIRRKKYLSMITNHQANSYRYEIDSDIERTLAVLNLQGDEMGYCILHESIHGNLVRAVSSKLILLQDYRKRFHGTERYTLDPIC